MRMQREEKIVVVLLLMALGSLAVAFWAFGPEDDALAGVKNSDSGTKEKVSLSVEGQVLEKNPTKSGGNLIIRLDSTPLPVFISSKAGAEEIQDNVDIGDRVRIKGTVSSFQGIDEITVDRAMDVVSIGENN
jgi:DNA/RNA endonuclease YhcR with UshA esterase domain